MRYIILIALLLFVLASSLAQNADASGQVPDQPVSACYEDQPCWSWPTMGNHKRGVVTMHGTPLVVGPCRFARLYRNGNLDRSHPSQRMHGDRWAVRNGCKRP